MTEKVTNHAIKKRHLMDFKLLNNLLKWVLK